MIPIHIEKSFCAAKWLMVTMHFGMAENHSCYHPPIHQWDLEEVKKKSSALHNTQHKIAQRRLMLSGDKPAECNYCFDMERIDPQAITDRKRFTNEVWAKERINEILLSKADKHFNPAYLEISFSSLCNFACSYCSPGQSSRWEQEIKRFGSYPVDDPTVHYDKMHEMILEENNPYIDAFWKWLPKMYKDLRYLRITGGEPLTTRNFLKLLDFIAANENKDLTLVINTNLCVPKKNLEIFFEKAKTLLDADTIKGIEVYTSMDTWGEQAEYIRDGLDITKWEQNVRRIGLDFKLPIRIMVTFGALSIFNFENFIRKVVELRSLGIDIQFNIARLVDPKQFDLRILPSDCDGLFYHIDTIMQTLPMKEVEKETWEMILSYWQSKTSTLTKDEINYRTEQFKLFFMEYDKRRGKNFCLTFPELTEWYEKSTTL